MKVHFSSTHKGEWEEMFPRLKKYHGNNYGLERVLEDILKRLEALESRPYGIGTGDLGGSAIFFPEKDA